MIDAGKSQIFDGVGRRQIARLLLGVSRIEPSVANRFEECSQPLDPAPRTGYVMAGHSWWFDSVRNANLEWRVALRHMLPIL